MENTNELFSIFNSTEAFGAVSMADDSHIYAKQSAYDEATVTSENSSNYQDYYYAYDTDDYDYYYFEIYSFEKYALGFVQPILILLTTLINLFVVGYFLLNKRNRGKATSLLFVSIAFSDTMTGVTLLPNGFGVYAIDNAALSKDWCNIYMILRFYVSQVFYTVSVWQRVVLCIQRYLRVCYPFLGRFCTFWMTVTSIIVMYCLAIVMHVYHIVDNKLGHFRCRWQRENPCVETCIYLWFCVALQRLLPCIILVSLTFISIKELKLDKTQRRVSTMTHQKSVSQSARDKIITYTSALIMIVFLIPELPYGIYRLKNEMKRHEGAYYRDNSPQEYHIIICVYEIALFGSFSANFWIYCFMMRDFRYSLLKLLTCGLARLRPLSMQSRGDSSRTTLSQSSSNASRNMIFNQTTFLPSTESGNVHVLIPLTLQETATTYIIPNNQH